MNDARPDPPDPTGRFEGLAEDYARFRPTYPSETVDAIVEAVPQNAQAIDVGAGTGIMTTLLAERGLRVLAVEPSADMRRKARRHPGVEWIDAAAEALTLPDDSADLIVAAQAMHWFDAPRALAEFARVLRPGGRLAIVWNLRDLTLPLGAAFQEVMETFGERQTLAHTASDPGPPVPETGAHGLGPARRLAWRHQQDLNLDAFLGRARSASYAPEDEPARTDCYRALEERFRAIADADGLAPFPYETVLYLAEKAG